jgi:hypothetical protein
LGKPYQREGEIDSLLLIDVLQKVVANPQLVKVIQNWPKMSAEGKAALLQYMEVLSEPTSNQGTRKKKKKR